MFVHSDVESINLDLGLAINLQADALEHALIAALPLGPQSAAGGISLPDSFHGELQVQSLFSDCTADFRSVCAPYFTRRTLPVTALVRVAQSSQWHISLSSGCLISHLSPLHALKASLLSGATHRGQKSACVGLFLAEQPILPPHPGLASDAQQKRRCDQSCWQAPSPCLESGIPIPCGRPYEPGILSPQCMSDILTGGPISYLWLACCATSYNS